MFEYLWGVDVGLNTTSIAAVSEGSYAIARPRAGKGTISARLGSLCDDTQERAEALLPGFPPLFVLIEQPFGRHVHPHLQWACGAVTVGIYKATLARFKHPVSIAHVGPPEWKKGLGLKGNAAKADVRTWAESQIGMTVAGLTEHDLDAYAIATYAERNRS